MEVPRTPSRLLGTLLSDYDQPSHFEPTFTPFESGAVTVAHAQSAQILSTYVNEVNVWMRWARERIKYLTASREVAIQQSKIFQQDCDKRNQRIAELEKELAELKGSNAPTKSIMRQSRRCQVMVTSADGKHTEQCCEVEGHTGKHWWGSGD